jgi:hypothetical protein
LPTVHEILTGFVLPSILAAVALTIAWFPRGKGRDGRWMGALAISGAFALADCVIGGANAPLAAGNRRCRLLDHLVRGSHGNPGVSGCAP